VFRVVNENLMGGSDHNPAKGPEPREVEVVASNKPIGCSSQRRRCPEPRHVEGTTGPCRRGTLNRRVRRARLDERESEPSRPAVTVGGLSTQVTDTLESAVRGRPRPPRDENKNESADKQHSGVTNALT